MRTEDLHELPKVRDRWSYLYAEHARIDKEAKAIAIHDATGVTAVPCASLSVLMLGPGTKLTHAAAQTLADNDCLVLWTGEEGVRLYAHGQGGTRSARNLLHQARLATRRSTRLEVVRRLYTMRFADPPGPDMTLRQIRGMEGARVRDTYAAISRETGVPWSGRNYNRGDWASADPVNRALSTANACLYGICHAAILSAGYAAALGFIHTGKQLSFVYDIGDLYKTEITIPVAFRMARDTPAHLERAVRHACRDAFQEQRILRRIVDDIAFALDVPHSPDDDPDLDFDTDSALPGALWDPESGEVQGGVNYADNEAGPGEPEP